MVASTTFSYTGSTRPRGSTNNLCYFPMEYHGTGCNCPPRGRTITTTSDKPAPKVLTEEEYLKLKSKDLIRKPWSNISLCDKYIDCHPSFILRQAIATIAPRKSRERGMGIKNFHAS